MKITTAIGQAWREIGRPALQPNHCIIGARVALETLTYFGVPSKVQPVLCVGFNDAAEVELRAGHPVTEWPPEAWSVGIGAHSEEMTDGPGWSGHVVVLTEEHLIDLAAGQLDRASKGIRTDDGIIIARRDAFVADAFAPFFAGLVLPLLKGHYLVAGEPENTSYKQTRDWRVNYRDFAGPVIRRVRELTEVS